MQPTSQVCVVSSVTHTVGIYSPGNALAMYEISIHVLPEAPSPTTTHFRSLSLSAMATMYVCID